MNGPHGHVVPRADGSKARCGGPAMCSVCKAELDALPGPPRCPACGSNDVSSKGMRLICLADGCPRPTAAAEILADGETDHIVVFSDTGWTMRHPLAERLDDALMTCTMGHLVSQNVDRSRPWPPGEYRATYEPPHLVLRPVT